MSRSGSFFDGFIFGAIAGAVIGLLYAPSPGEETRKKIKKIHDDNEDVIDDTKEKIDDLITKTRDSIEKGFDKLGDMISDKGSGLK